MIRAVFTIRNSNPVAFTVNGHSGSAESGRDIICSAVSSACYMAVNTITEIIGENVDATVEDGYMKISLCGESKAATDILKGLMLHISELSKDYPNFISITTEV